MCVAKISNELLKEIWFTENEAMREKLFQIQRKGLLAIAKTYKPVTTFSLNLLIGFPSIDIKIKERKNIWQQLQDVKNFFKKIGISINFDYATEVSAWKITSIPWRTFNETNYVGKNIFTDGSEINHRIGCAMVVFEDGNEKGHVMWRLNNETKVFIAEMSSSNQRSS
ncbi:hypothetical protein AVEN_115406-1 [Araneus ventricosus]|uniref:RNase H type-1 domain-containing protein n=1 Tax=Araneus ventricosus TaxID=182803 RepID=A0A4Y2A0B0_ARAVE|nr:hypothetical protein AVEN_115406-1 [Araneus ventricosus]